MSTRNWLELSLAQRSIWLEAKLNRQSLYLLGGWSKVEANLDESDVRQAISLMMARHEALRLRVDEEEPRQWLDDSVQAPLTVVVWESPDDRDAADRNVVDQDAAFHAYVQDVFRRPLPWGDRPLFHIDLVQVGHETSYLVWRFHHLIADSFSVLIAIEHWVQAYLALTSGSVIALAPVSSYLRVIDSDKAYLQSREYKDDIAYWKRRFRTLPPSLISESDIGHMSNGTQFSFEWTMTAEPYSRLIEVAQKIGVPSQRVLFALFALALGIRYRQSDLVLGLALHRRDLSSRFALGMFSGVIAVRWEVRETVVVSKAIHQFSEQIDSDLRHQRLPMDDLARALGLFRAGRRRLFEVVMSYLPVGPAPEQLSIDGLTVNTGTARARESSPITLHLQELQNLAGLAIQVSVNDQILEGSEAHSLLSLLHTLCEALLEEPGATIKDFISHAVGNERVEADRDDILDGHTTEEWTV